MTCLRRLRRAPRAHLEHDPEKACPALDAGWVPVFGKRSCSKTKIERDDDLKKSHPVLCQYADDRADQAGRERSRDDRFHAERDYVVAPLRRHGGKPADHDAEAAEVGKAA